MDYREEFCNVTIAFPEPVVKDVTDEKLSLETVLSNMKLGEIIDECDECLHATVKCPWGCSEFLHKMGYVPFDLMYAKVLDRSEVPIMSKMSKKCNLCGMVNDFLIHDFGELILLNPAWQVTPCMSYISGVGPCILTCRDHRKGCKQKMFHPPRNPFGPLPAPFGDQLAPAVIVPRTIKPMKANAYSNSYQMHSMRGYYGGVDTLSIADRGRFDYDSNIARKYESLCLEGRNDVKGMVSRWKEDGKVLPKNLGESMLKQAKRDVPNIASYKQEWGCGNFVTVHDAMKLYCALKSSSTSVTKLMLETDDERKEIQIVGKWPNHLIFLHQPNEHGASFPMIPRMSMEGHDFCLLWIVTSMLTTLPSLWEETVNSLEDNLKWNGWTLTYAAYYCLTDCSVRQSKNNPFKLRRKMPHFWASQHLYEDTLGDISIPTEFYYESMDTLFSQHISTVVIHNGTFDPMVPDNSVENWHDCKHVVLIRDMASSSEYLEDVVFDETGTCHWELRYLCSTSTGEERNEWSTCLYCRHGGSCFPGWWKCERLAKMTTSTCRYFSQDGEIPVSMWEEWNVAIYVKVENVEFDKVRDQFLSILGGQHQVFCDVHNVPLVIAPFRDEINTACCMHDDVHGIDNDVAVCGNRVAFQCPVDGCVCKICTEHHRYICANLQGDEKGYVIFDDQVRQKLSVSSCDEVFSSEEMSSSTEESSLENVDDNMDNAKKFRRHKKDIDVEIDDEDDESEYYDDVQDDDSLLSESFEDQKYFNDNLLDSIERINVGDEDFVHGENIFDDVVQPGNINDNVSPNADFHLVNCLEPEDAIVGCDENAIEDLIPTTAQGQNALNVEVKGHFISGHVILNNCGRLLARKHGKLTGTTRQRNFLEKIVANTTGYTVPLLYPEAMLFPSLFWKGTNDGAVIGSLPCGLLADDAFLRSYGFAGVAEHMRCRVKNPSMLSSTDYRYIYYAFDSIANLSLRGHDSRVILNRGFSTKSRRLDFDPCPDKDVKGFRLNSDHVDSRQTVNWLAAAIAEKQATYFYTHTCNQKNHFGVRKIKAWLDDPGTLDVICNGMELTLQEREDIHNSLIKGSCVVMLRNWMETCEIWMNYIWKSPEKPLGNINRIWWRHEYQESQGNLSHIHALLWTDDDLNTPVGWDDATDRIRGDLRELIRVDEAPALLEEGIFKSMDDFNETLNMASRILLHTCSERCMKRVDGHSGKLKCRFTNNAKENPNPHRHSLKSINVSHSTMAQRILTTIGFLKKDINNGCIVTSEECMIARKHYPRRIQLMV